jgi:hypothetical protein
MAQKAKNRPIWSPWSGIETFLLEDQIENNQSRLLSVQHLIELV